MAKVMASKRVARFTNPTSKELKYYISDRRNELDIKLETVARNMGISRGGISNVMYGTHNLNLVTLDRYLRDGVNCDVVYSVHKGELAFYRNGVYEIGNICKAMRRYSGMSQKEFVNKSGVLSINQYAYIEQGKRCTTVEKIVEIANALGYDFVIDIYELEGGGLIYVED